MFILITLPKLRIIRSTEATLAKDADKLEGLPVKSAHDLLQVPGPVLVKMYNLANPKKPISRFADRKVAAERVFPLMDGIAEAGKSRAPRAAGTPRKAGEVPERWGKFAGKTIIPLVTENPRRANTHGWRSMAVILKAGKAGISYEAFLAAGGRRQDLAWDQTYKRVEIK